MTARIPQDGAAAHAMPAPARRVARVASGAMLALAALLNGCALLHWHGHDDAAQAARQAMDAQDAAQRRAAATPAQSSDGSARVQSDGVEIEKVPFRSGISSATVEQLAKRAGCTSSVGAGLVSQPGPVEVYRMACDDGKVFLAKCELRQCKPM